ncbi:MAG: hypothetical protein WCG44_04325 [bacterium]
MNRKFPMITAIVISVAFVFSLASTALAADITFTVIPIGKAPVVAYSLSWSGISGNVAIGRKEDSGSWQKITDSTTESYVDFSISATKTYAYRLTQGGTLVKEGTAPQENIGTPTISAIKVEAGSTSKTEASVIVTFTTDTLSHIQLFYGETKDYGSQTVATTDLNQSHTVLLEKLKPNTTYHLSASAISKDPQYAATSGDTTFTTPPSPTDMSIMQIILDALTKAFSGFNKWFNGE